ncbi:adenylyl-sulfate kinase [Desulfocurvus sp. DL9XJH121]
MIIWIIGLSGAGKTTLAQETVALARRRLANVALVDGDVLREVWGGDLGHTMEDRKRNADRLCRLCRYLESQGIHAVCAVLSLFEESRVWNRDNLGQYYEVYVRTPLNELKARDPKGLYARALAGEIDLPGVSLPFAEPENSDLVIENTADRAALLAHASRLAVLFQNEK